MRVAIVGSRRRTDRAAVEACVAELPSDGPDGAPVVVSGGAAGPDSWAAEAARRRGLEVRVHRPDLAGARSYGEAARAYHARNQRIVEDCDRLIAFVGHDRTGGTEGTIRRARRAGKPVELR
jgi:hypothetical protein